MSNNETCDLEGFEAAIGKLIGNIPRSVADKVGNAAAASGRKAAKRLRGDLTDGIGKHEWSEKYRSGFTSHTVKGTTPSAEVGNKGKPGLVHLLEKGHATLTGRKTAAYPHMRPAFEEMSEDFVKRVDKAVGEALVE